MVENAIELRRKMTQECVDNVLVEIGKLQLCIDTLVPEGLRFLQELKVGQMLHTMNGLQERLAIALEELHSEKIVDELVLMLRQCGPIPSAENIMMLKNHCARLNGTACETQQNDEMMCVRCSGRMTLRVDESCLSCDMCGATKYHQQIETAYPPFSVDDADVSSRVSKKITGFRTFIHKCQSNETYGITQQILHNIKAMMSRDFQYAYSEENVHTVLEALVLPKLYKARFLIYNQLCMQPVPFISNEMECKMCDMFMRMSDSFRQQRPTGR